MQHARRKAIYEKLHPETVATNKGGGFKGNQHKDEVADNLSATSSYAADAANAVGETERTVRRKTRPTRARVNLFFPANHDLQ